MDNNNEKYRKWKNFVLFTILGIVLISVAPVFLDRQTVSQTEWQYNKLIEEVKKKPTDVSRITISSDRTYVEATVSDGSEGNQKVRVKLPNDPNFTRILTENNIEVDVAPRRTEDGAEAATLVNVISNLAIPTLLFTTLIFFAYRNNRKV